jgi:hypothetical protein
MFPTSRVFLEPRRSGQTGPARPLFAAIADCRRAAGPSAADRIADFSDAALWRIEGIGASAQNWLDDLSVFAVDELDGACRTSERRLPLVQTEQAQERGVIVVVRDDVLGSLMA